MAEDAAPKGPEEEMRDKAARYGVAYAVMADGFKGAGVDRLVKGVRLFLLASAAFVVAAAIYASMVG